MPRERGKKNGSDLLIASFNNKIKEGFENLNASRALLLVSIQGNQYCCGDYLQAEIATGISEHQTFTVLIADEIYWHNLRPEAHCFLELLLKDITEKPEQEKELISNFIPKFFDSLLGFLQLGMDYKNSFLEMDSKEQIEVLWHLKARIEKKLRLEARALGDRFFEENLLSILSALKLDITQMSPNFSTLTVDEKINYLNELAIRGDIPSLIKNGGELRCNFSIVRWEQWQSQASFLENKLTIEHIMQTIPPVEESIQQAAIEFAERHSKQDKVPKNVWQMRSQYYFREEAPVIMWLAARNGYDFIAYPGERLEPFANVQEVFIGSQNKYDIPESLFTYCDNEAPYWLDIHFRWKKNQSAGTLVPIANSGSNTNSPPKSPIATHGIFAHALESNQDNAAEFLSPEDVSKKINELLMNCPSQFKLEVLEHLMKTVKESSLKSSTAGMSGFP